MSVSAASPGAESRIDHVPNLEGHERRERQVLEVILNHELCTMTTERFPHESASLGSTRARRCVGPRAPNPPEPGSVRFVLGG
jgi:hypothetical protein